MLSNKIKRCCSCRRADKYLRADDVDIIIAGIPLRQHSGLPVEVSTQDKIVEMMFVDQPVVNELPEPLQGSAPSLPTKTIWPRLREGAARARGIFAAFSRFS